MSIVDVTSSSQKIGTLFRASSSGIASCKENMPLLLTNLEKLPLIVIIEDTREQTEVSEFN